jgi:nucleoside-triphosphatase THEP1
LGVAGSSTSSSYGIYEQGGGIFSTGNITAYSDRRKKENIITVDNALEKVNNLRGVYYNRIDDEEKKRQVGVIAQETEKVLPEAVTYSVDVDEYGVSYGNMAGVFIEAIKELTNQVKELKQEIEELKNGTNSN